MEGYNKQKQMEKQSRNDNPSQRTNSIMQYISPCTVVLDLSVILTIDKKLTIGLPYLYLEGDYIDAVQLLDVREENDTVFIKTQDFQTGKIKTVSWSEGNSETNLWSLISLAYLQKLATTTG